MRTEYPRAGGLTRGETVLARRWGARARTGGRLLAGIRLALLVALLAAIGPSWAGELSLASSETRPELRLLDLQGVEQGLGALRGQVVLVNFWASWCSPCLEEIPSLQRLADGMRGRPVAVIGVNVSERAGRVRMAVRQHGIRFPVLMDEDGSVFRGWGGVVLPTTYVLDQEGHVRYVGRGPLEWDGGEAIATIEGLLSEPDADSKDRGGNAEPPG